jgi:hypothetical protein
MKSIQKNIKSHSSFDIHQEFSRSIPIDLLSKLMNESERIRIFDPLTTLRLFLMQIFQQYSCKGVIAQFNIEQVKTGKQSISTNTSCFTRAKNKLPESLLKKMALEVKCESQSPKWNNRNVKIIDGTTMIMNDTEKNQIEYPQNIRQKKGLGQPIMRILGVFAHRTGKLLDLELAPYSGKGTAATSLLLKIISKFNKSDILVMDRFYTSYFLHYDLIEKGIDFLVRLRDKTGEKYFKGNQKDKIIQRKLLPKPKNMEQSSYELYPTSYGVRIIKHRSIKKGFRDKIYYFITSMENYSSDDLAMLYMDRWNAETNIRNLKRTLGSYFLKSKSPSMVRKELYVYVLGYNLIRSLISLSSKQINPQKISFKCSLFYFLEIMKDYSEILIYKSIELLKNEVLKNRFRIEPRALKRRMKSTYSYLMEPRSEFKARNGVC